MKHTTLQGRAEGALYGAALGDALGMPTQDLSPETIRADYGYVHTLLAPGPHQIIAANQPAGAVTDDTEQMLIVAQMLASAEGFDAAVFAERLDAWEQDMRLRGSLDLLGPSTKAAIEAIRSGVPPEQSGMGATTNGAAMRAAPIGIACPPDPEVLVEETIRVAQVTHNSAPSAAAAAAVAAAVSAGIEGANIGEALRFAEAVSARAEQSAPPVIGPSFTSRWKWAKEYLAASSNPEKAAYEVVGTTVVATESVVVALVAAEIIEDPWKALCFGANVGGDTDTIATIIGAITGSAYGVQAFPKQEIDSLIAVNGFDFAPLTQALLSHRSESTTALLKAQMRSRENIQ